MSGLHLLHRCFNLLQKFCMQNEANQGHKERTFVLNRVVKLVIFVLK